MGWSLEEDSSLLEHLFKSKPCNIATVRSINFSSFSNIEINRRKQNISRRYQAILKPILLNYHLGTLNYNWKYKFFTQISNNNYKNVKEIVWEELINFYPGQTVKSLRTEISTAMRYTRNLSFREAIKEHARKIRNTDDNSERKKEYHQKIVDVYSKCTMPSIV